jgi:hypothetical protein
MAVAYDPPRERARVDGGALTPAKIIACRNDFCYE